MMRLISVQIGQPTAYPIPDAGDSEDREFTSGIGKRAVAGPVRLSTLGLDGDAVADRRNHGGPDQAVLAYAGAHYPRWRAEWGRSDVSPGDFGENLTVDGTDDLTACLGDRWAIGDTVLEITKPRSPCNRLAWYQRRGDLIARVRATGRSGWYLRVIVAGTIEAGARIELVTRTHPELTVRRAANAMLNRQHGADRDRDEAMLLVRCEALAQDWRLRLAREGFVRGPAT